MDDDVGEGNALGPEEQGGGAPVASRAPGDKIRPRSRYFGSAAKARHNKATSVTAKAPLQNAADIPRREAARSVIGRQAIISRVTEESAGRGGAVPVLNIFAQFLRATPGCGAAQSAEVAPIRLTGSSAPETSHEASVQHVRKLQFKPVGPTRDTVPSAVTSFGREATRSVFVANPNWEGGAQGIRDT
ncbi:hypothetical protein C8A03DRAFT_15526 [Achaetomium macrosporum]|uniref:Uncharacterized protein n=1 Tax=Achaetomium macrosporum TaxID=79813 RepID=A0AAN7CBJ2_9PEZI|nr:hypothetical protein C8A03DRAFT_15526 [Achaetomium macrosporum]